jgi:hypothetical protein
MVDPQTTTDEQCPNCGHYWDLGELMYAVSQLTDEQWLYVTDAKSAQCRKARENT